MLDFPASPSVGQKYPASPLAGIPTYTWDGEKWTTQGGSIVSASPGTLLPLMDAKPALVGVSTNFSREDHVHPVDTSRASFDAMAYSGLQINGGMEVSQERGTTGTNAANTYMCDGWKLQFSGTMAVTGSQLLANYFPYFAYLAQIVVGTAQASLGAGDFTGLYQVIEGWRCIRLSWGTANAQPITLGFWSRHSRAGLYSGAVRNGAVNRTYAFTYTQTAADTPQYNTVTIPGDTSGAWVVDNTVGMYLSFSMGAGSTQTAPSANTWIAGSYLAAPGQVNGVAATTDIFRITGLTVLPGNEAPSAARSPFVMRPYDQELVTCQRYYEPLTFPTTGLAQLVPGGLNGANYYSQWYFHAKKRATPTIALAPGAAWAVGTPTAYPGIDNVIFYVSANSAFVLTGTAGANGLIADARL